MLGRLPIELLERILDEMQPVGALPASAHFSFPQLTWATRPRHLLRLSTVSRLFCEITQRLAHRDPAFDTPESLEAYLDQIAAETIDAGAARSMSFELKSDTVQIEYNTMLGDISEQAQAFCYYLADLTDSDQRGIDDDVLAGVREATREVGWPYNAEKMLQARMGRLIEEALTTWCSPTTVRFSDAELVYWTDLEELAFERLVVTDMSWTNWVIDEERATVRWDDINAFFSQLISRSPALLTMEIGVRGGSLWNVLPTLNQTLRSLTVANAWTSVLFGTAIAQPATKLSRLAVILPHWWLNYAHDGNEPFFSLICGDRGELVPNLRWLELDPVATCCYTEYLYGIFHSAPSTLKRLQLRLDLQTGAPSHEVSAMLSSWSEGLSNHMPALRRFQLTIPQAGFGQDSEVAIDAFRSRCSARGIDFAVTSC